MNQIILQVGDNVEGYHRLTDDPYDHGAIHITWLDQSGYGAVARTFANHLELARDDPPIRLGG